MISFMKNGEYLHSGTEEEDNDIIHSEAAELLRDGFEEESH